MKDLYKMTHYGDNLKSITKELEAYRKSEVVIQENTVCLGDDGGGKRAPIVMKHHDILQYLCKSKSNPLSFLPGPDDETPIWMTEETQESESSSQEEFHDCEDYEPPLTPQVRTPRYSRRRQQEKEEEEERPKPARRSKSRTPYSPVEAENNIITPPPTFDKKDFVEEAAAAAAAAVAPVLDTEQRPPPIPKPRYSKGSSRTSLNSRHSTASGNSNARRISMTETFKQMTTGKVNRSQ